MPIPPHNTQNPIAHIFPRIVIATPAVLHVSSLRQLGVTHVLLMSKFVSLERIEGKGFETLQIINYHPENLQDSFNQCFDFIEQALEQPHGKLLMISSKRRPGDPAGTISATIVIAFLRRRGMDLMAAIVQVTFSMLLWDWPSAELFPTETQWEQLHHYCDHLDQMGIHGQIMAIEEILVPGQAGVAEEEEEAPAGEAPKWKTWTRIKYLWKSTLGVSTPTF
ncbi:Protein-tyrosine phosphatase-like [Trema orientale]|uniref:Protein-tyrosine phosphatase-like n=1 Tax=Trema orientale TaxID=63057 RepID=A0A2P5FWN2_TREOI|nr:Protein-tyrosine phosphatase-like [Trema orientale]